MPGFTLPKLHPSGGCFGRAESSSKITVSLCLPQEASHRRFLTAKRRLGDRITVSWSGTWHLDLDTELQISRCVYFLQFCVFKLNVKTTARKRISCSGGLEVEGGHICHTQTLTCHIHQYNMGRWDGPGVRSWTWSRTCASLILAWALNDGAQRGSIRVFPVIKIPNNHWNKQTGSSYTKNPCYDLSSR